MNVDCSTIAHTFERETEVQKNKIFSNWSAEYFADY